MSHPALYPRPLTRTAIDLAPRSGYLLLFAALCVAAAWLVQRPVAGLVLLVVGMTFLATTLVVQLLAAGHRRRHRHFFDVVSAFVEQDGAASFTTDADGCILHRNRAARARFGDRDDQTLAAVLAGLFASPATVLFRLRARAEARGSAQEDLVVRRGHLRLSVHKLGGDGFLWRFEDLGDRGASGRSGENISLPMLTVSKNGTVLFMNEAMRKLLGRRETTLDRIFSDVPVEDGARVTVQGADTATRAQACVIDAQGGRREIFLVPDRPGAAGRSAGQGLVDGLPVPLLKLDANGIVTMASRRARRLLDAEDAVGRHMADLVEGLGRSVTEWLREAGAPGRDGARAEMVRASRPANEVFLQVALARVSDPDGSRLVAVLHDATELKTLEAQFVQAQKMQAIGQLAGGVAHDFNNLLTAITGHCDLLLLRHDRGDPDYADLAQINENANRAAALVGQLLAFSRKQTLRPETIDLSESLGELTHLLNRLVGEKVTLELAHDYDLHPIRADRRKLEQVLMNLVVNARDAMPDGGRIRIETRNVTLKEPLERDRAQVAPGDYVTVKVSDQGCGIAPDKLPKIFEPFFTTKTAGKGTGLGLSVAYGIVKQSGGFIFVDSVPGAGSEFTLYFPVCRARDSVASEAAVPAPVAPLGPACATPPAALPPDAAELPSPTHSADPAPGGNVLLVEDEAPVRAFASRALRLKGYSVLEAGNAEEALRILEDEAVRVDIFVTDVVMPGMDGPTWVAEALRHRPGVKVVFVSGYAEDSASDHQARIPNSVFLPKPFSLSELTETVQRQLH